MKKKKRCSLGEKCFDFLGQGVGNFYCYVWVALNAFSIQFCRRGWLFFRNLYCQTSQSIVISSINSNILRSVFNTSCHVFLGLPFPQVPSTFSDRHFCTQLFLLICITCPNQRILLSLHLIHLMTNFFSQHSCAQSIMHTDVANLMKHTTSISPQCF